MLVCVMSAWRCNLIRLFPRTMHISCGISLPIFKEYNLLLVAQSYDKVLIEWLIIFTAILLEKDAYSLEQHS